MHWMKPREVSSSGGIICQAKTVVRIHVRRIVAQVQVEQTCIGAIAPIAAVLSSHPIYYLLAEFIQPPAILPISLTCLIHISYLLTLIYSKR